MPVATTYSNNTEQNLTAGMLLGSKDALDTLYRKYGPMLMGFIQNIVADRKMAEEVLQGSFIEIWSRRHEYKAGPERLFPWMLRVTRALALQKVPIRQNFINEEILNSNIVVNNNGVLNTEYPGISTQAEKNAYLTGLQETVFNLMYINGYSVAEVAGTVKIAADDVKKTLRGAMNKVKTVQHG